MKIIGKELKRLRRKRFFPLYIRSREQQNEGKATDIKIADC